MKNKLLTQVEAMKSVRKVWGFKPVSRVVPDKTRYSRKNKHQGRED